MKKCWAFPICRLRSGIYSSNQENLTVNTLFVVHEAACDIPMRTLQKGTLKQLIFQIVV